MSVLLDQSKQLSSAFARNKMKEPSAKPACDERPRFKGRFDVIAQKSRRKPRGACLPLQTLFSGFGFSLRYAVTNCGDLMSPGGAEMEEWNLTFEERLLRHEVGRYLDSGCTVGVEVELHRPLRTLQEGDAEHTGPATEVSRGASCSAPHVRD